MSARLCGRRPKRLSFCAESFLFTISGTCRLADSSYRMRGDPLNEEVLDWVEPDFSCLASVQSYYLSIFKLNSIFPPSLCWTGLIFLSPCTLQALCNHIYASVWHPVLFAPSVGVMMTRMLKWNHSHPVMIRYISQGHLCPTKGMGDKILSNTKYLMVWYWP